MKGNLRTKEDEVCHLLLFLEHFVITQDEHDDECPFKPLPYIDMPHVSYIAQLWIYKNLLVIAKSRQLMVTWLFCAFLLWDAMFKMGRLNIIIDKKEDDADGTIDRIKFIYEHLPHQMKTLIPAQCTPQGQLGSRLRLPFPENNSKIIGLPQNPDAIRKNTASCLFFDEAAFKERAEECHIASMPTIRGGGKIAVISTPKGQNFFCKLFSDL